MANTVRRTITLPEDLAREADALASAEEKTLSGVIEDALRLYCIRRRHEKLNAIQNYWSSIARDRGILTEGALAAYLDA